LINVLKNIGDEQFVAYESSSFSDGNYSYEEMNSNNFIISKLESDYCKSIHFSSDIIRAKTSDNCETDETEKYWYNYKWNDTPLIIYSSTVYYVNRETKSLENALIQCTSSGCTIIHTNEGHYSSDEYLSGDVYKKLIKSSLIGCIVFNYNEGYYMDGNNKTES